MILTTEETQRLSNAAIELNETVGYMKDLVSMIEDIWNAVPWYHKFQGRIDFKNGIVEAKGHIRLYEAIAKYPKNAFTQVHNDLGIGLDDFLNQTLNTAQSVHVVLTRDWQLLTMRYEQALNNSPWSIRKLFNDLVKLVSVVTWVLPSMLIKHVVKSIRKLFTVEGEK